MRMFLADLVRLMQRGLARHYNNVEDNLPGFGRIRFPQHVRRNAANRARFYVAFDEFTADRPVNRLIHSASTSSGRSPPTPTTSNCSIGFASSSPKYPGRSGRRWTGNSIGSTGRCGITTGDGLGGLFLFNHGLATFSGKHVNQALLFPMERSSRITWPMASDAISAATGSGPRDRRKRSPASTEHMPSA